MPAIRTVGLLTLLTGCATTGATLGGGVGDRELEHPPWYAGKGAAAAATIAHFPIVFQRGASQSPIFDPGSGANTAIAALLAEMNWALDSLPASAGGTLALVLPTGTPPDVYFGCARDAADDCVERGDSALARQGTTMQLALHRSSRAWIEAAGRMMDSPGATHVFFITLEVGQYWVRQSGLAGKKSVELGRGYSAAVPWVTSLETPVSVLQLTGVLVNRKGLGVRIGAEGIMARHTPLLASGFGAQRLVSDEDVGLARSLRREELPGKPLAWQAALCRLVADLN